MGKKVREYKAGDFIFAKVKGYPAWPARVQKMNGKKYFVYFYGTGETANLPPNMIFDYAENKDKFLTKTVKRRDFNDGVKQIEHDFANNVPLEEVIGVPIEAPADVDETLNDTANDTADDTVADTTAADDTVADESTANATQNETAVEDSDEAGALVIDEGNKKGKKAKPEPKPKETPKPKEPKTPRGKAKKEESKEEEEDKEKEKKEEEIVSRSGRKIRPKRYIDEQTEENTTLPSPAPKKRRGASPSAENKEKPEEKSVEKNNKLYNTVPLSELEDLKEPFKPEPVEIITLNNEVSINSQNTQKIIPKFGKKKNANQKKSNTVSNTKKFVPPTKNSQSITDNSQPIFDLGDKYLLPKSHIDMPQESTKNLTEINQIEQSFNLYSFRPAPQVVENYKSTLQIDLANICDQYNPTFDTEFSMLSNDNVLRPKEASMASIYDQYMPTDPNCQASLANNTDQCISILPTSSKVKKSKNTKADIGKIIFGTLSVLNDEEINETFDNKSVNLSQSQNESFCSVTSLKKTYKDLDVKSFEIKENDAAEKSQETQHKIPEGDDFFNLFLNRSSTGKPVPMSVELDDMGFKIKYAEYMKKSLVGKDEFGGSKEVYFKILHKFPVENEKLIKKYQ